MQELRQDQPLIRPIQHPENSSHLSPRQGAMTRAQRRGRHHGHCSSGPSAGTWAGLAPSWVPRTCPSRRGPPESNPAPQAILVTQTAADRLHGRASLLQCFRICQQAGRALAVHPYRHGAPYPAGSRCAAYRLGPFHNCRATTEVPLYAEATQHICCRMPMHMATLHYSTNGLRDKSHATKNRGAPEEAVPLRAP